MEKRFVKLTQEKYITHTCPHCASVQGDNYVVCDNHQHETTVLKETLAYFFVPLAINFILHHKENKALIRQISD